MISTSTSLMSDRAAPFRSPDLQYDLPTGSLGLALVMRCARLATCQVVQVDAGRAAVATPPGGLAVDGRVRGVVLPELRLNPPANARLEVDDVDPAKDPRIGSLTETPLGGGPEKLQKPPAPLLAVWNDRLAAGHARKHADDRQAEQCGERVPLTLGAARIVKALKKFHQRSAGVHARVLIRSPSDVIHHIRWI